MKKRLLSAIMAIVLVISLLPSVAIPALAAWDSSYWTGKGSGTMADPYQITDASELEKMDGAPGGVWFQVTKDLTFDTFSNPETGQTVIPSFNGILDGGGSGSTKVLSSSVTLNNCELNNLYLGGINGEVAESSIMATDCTIEYLSATNRGFVGTANVDLNNCDITEKLNFGAANGCFETDSGKTDGSGITGSSVWNIDAETTVAAAALTPLAMRDENDEVNIRNTSASPGR